MKVMFFLEPSIELNNPLFRYATLRNSLLPQIRALKETGEEVLLLASAPIVEQSINDGFDRIIPRVAVIDPIVWMGGENARARALRLHQQLWTHSELETIRRHIFGAMPKGFEPDIIIVWESPADYLKLVFPQALILYQMPGFFSRAPFPSLVSFDTGLLENSTRTTQELACKPTVELEAFEELRRREDSFFRSISPVREMVEAVRAQFSSIILYPLQIDGYFMVDHVLGRERGQFDVLLSLLSQIPSNQALWVTNYKSKDTQSSVLSDQNLRYLRERFPNFIYIERTDNIPCVSQYLVRELDATIVASSSVGFQAAFWGKPLLTLGTCHISPFASATSVEDLCAQAASGDTIDRDALIIDALQTRHPTMEFLSGKSYGKWLKEIKTTGSFPRWIDAPVATTLLKARRESDTLAQLAPGQEVNLNKVSDRCIELSHQLRRHDVISFDIFDTLVYRPFKTPSDLFDLMSEKAREITRLPLMDFRTERHAAERTAFKNANARGEGETSLSEIYQVLSQRLSLDQETLGRLMALELDLEMALIYPRQSGYIAFQEARRLGKQIVLISDMYLPETFIRELLDKNGYTGFERIFLSSTCKLKKHSGKLYDYALREMGIDPRTILHVGDNVDSDIKRAKESGIKPFHLVRALDKFEKSAAYTAPWKRDEERHSLDWKIILAILGNHLQDNPYGYYEDGTLFNGDPKLLGYYGLGPLLLGHAKWLVESACRDKVDRLYFLARDGKIVKAAFDKVAQIYKDAPRSNYLLCSRRSVNLAKIHDQAGILDLLHVDYAHNVSLGHFLNNRFGINSADIPQDILHKHGYRLESRLTKADLPRLQSLFFDIEDILLSVAQKERNNYLAYLSGTDIFAPGRVAVVDIGYAGTMQESLYEISQRKKKIGGYYLITFRQAAKRVAQHHLPITGYLADFIDRHDTYHPFCRHVPLYETLFSCADTSFIRMARDWTGRLKPVFMERTKSEDVRRRLVSAVHQGAIDFIEDAVRVLGPRLKYLDIEPNKSLRVLDLFFSSPHAMDARMLQGIEFEDAYGGRNKVLLPMANSSNSECVWIKGRDALAAQSQSGTASSGKATEKRASTEARGREAFRRKVIRWSLSLGLSERKKRKLERSPELFFHDARSSLVKSIGKIYLNKSDYDYTLH